MSMGNWSSCAAVGDRPRPPRRSRPRRRRRAGRAPPLVSAAASLISASARMNRRGNRSPEIGKLRTARWVEAPYRASAGTRPSRPSSRARCGCAAAPVVAGHRVGRPAGPAYRLEVTPEPDPQARRRRTAGRQPPRCPRSDISTPSVRSSSAAIARRRGARRSEPILGRVDQRPADWSPAADRARRVQAASPTSGGASADRAASPLGSIGAVAGARSCTARTGAVPTPRRCARRRSRACGRRPRRMSRSYRAARR